MRNIKLAVNDINNGYSLKSVNADVQYLNGVNYFVSNRNYYFNNKTNKVSYRTSKRNRAGVVVLDVYVNVYDDVYCLACGVGDSITNDWFDTFTKGVIRNFTEAKVLDFINKTTNAKVY